MRPLGFTKDGAKSVDLTKSETGRLLEGTYIAMQICRNLGKDHETTKELLPAVETMQKAAKKFGLRHLAADGSLKGPKPDEAEAPKGSVAP